MPNVCTCSTSPGRRRHHAWRSSRGSIRPSVQRTLDAFTGGPALVRNRRWDYLAANTWAAPSMRRCSTVRTARRTTSDTCSSTTAPETSSTMGRRSARHRPHPALRSRPRSARSRTRRAHRGARRRPATSSGRSGNNTTCASPHRAGTGSTTPRRRSRSRLRGRGARADPGLTLLLATAVRESPTESALHRLADMNPSENAPDGGPAAASATPAFDHLSSLSSLSRKLSGKLPDEARTYPRQQPELKRRAQNEKARGIPVMKPKRVTAEPLGVSLLLATTRKPVAPGRRREGGHDDHTADLLCRGCGSRGLLAGEPDSR